MSDYAFTPLAVPRLGETPVDVRGQAARARARGYADGFAEGRRAGLDEAREEQAVERERMEHARGAYLRQCGSALSALEAARVALDERLGLVGELSAARVEELAIELATVILGVELSDPARSASHALRRALDEAPLDRWIRVAVNEADAATLRTDADHAALLRDVDLAASPEVDPGGAIVSIENGVVDTRIGAALGRAAAALRGADESHEVTLS